MEVTPRTSQPATRNSISSFIEESKSLGFVAIGFSRPGRPLFFDQFCSWIAAGKQGEMAWLEKNLTLRENPGRLLDGCRTVITLAYPYSSNRPCTPDGFCAARYTEPEKTDYHDRLRKLAQALASLMVEWYPGCGTRICVDSAPILERSFAYASGIGFIGKNNMLIIPGYGSYVFLAEILTTAFLEYPETETMESQCGECTRCVDACPTGAFEKAFCLDCSKCLSYLTIEYRGKVNKETGIRMDNCFLGCDMCQEACPFNQGKSLKYLSLPSTNEILGMSEKDFMAGLGKTAFARVGLEKLKENIRAVRSWGRPFDRGF